MKFCTCHDSTAVMACAKFHYGSFLNLSNYQSILPTSRFRITLMKCSPSWVVPRTHKNNMVLLYHNQFLQNAISPTLITHGGQVAWTVSFLSSKSDLWTTVGIVVMCEIFTPIFDTAMTRPRPILLNLFLGEFNQKSGVDLTPEVTQ